MKCLLTILALFFLSACSSDDSTPAPVAGDEAPLSAPSGLKLIGTTPGNNPTPQVEVSGLKEGASVTLYSDSSCETAVSSRVRVAEGATQATITTNNLGDGDASITLYASQADEAENVSACSTVRVS